MTLHIKIRADMRDGKTKYDEIVNLVAKIAKDHPNVVVDIEVEI